MMISITVSATNGNCILIREDGTVVNFADGDSQVISFNDDENIILTAKSDEWLRYLYFNNSGSPANWEEYVFITLNSYFTHIEMEVFPTVDYELTMDYKVDGESHYFEDEDSMYQFTLDGIIDGTKKCLETLVFNPGYTPGTYGTNVLKVNDVTQSSNTLTISADSDITFERTATSSTYTTLYIESNTYIYLYNYYPSWGNWYYSTTISPLVEHQFSTSYEHRFGLYNEFSDREWQKFVIDGIEVEPDYIIDSRGYTIPTFTLSAGEYHKIKIYGNAEAAEAEAQLLTTYRKGTNGYWNLVDTYTVEDTSPKTTIERDLYAVIKNGRAKYNKDIYSDFNASLSSLLTPEMFMLLDPDSSSRGALTIGNAGDPYRDTYFLYSENEDTDVTITFKKENNIYWWQCEAGPSGDISEWIPVIPKNNRIVIKLYNSDFITNDYFRALTTVDNPTDLEVVFTYYTEDWDNPRFLLVEATGLADIYRPYRQ